MWTDILWCPFIDLAFGGRCIAVLRNIGPSEDGNAFVPVPPNLHLILGSCRSRRIPMLHQTNTLRSIEITIRVVADKYFVSACPVASTSVP